MNFPKPRFLDVDALCDEAEQAGYALADAKAAANLLEETRKSVLATTMANFLAGNMPVSKAETLALADPAYKDFVGRMVQARKAADRASVHWEILKTRIDLLRSNISMEKAAMNLR